MRSASKLGQCNVVRQVIRPPAHGRDCACERARSQRFRRPPGVEPCREPPRQRSHGSQRKRGPQGASGRAASRRAAAAALPRRRPQPRLPFQPTPAVSADELEAIHQASLTVLEEIGMDVLHRRGARQILKEAGAEVDADVASGCASTAGWSSRRSGSRRESSRCMRATRHDSLRIGGNALAFCSVASAPNCSDLDGGRRPGNRPDFQNLIRLGQMLNTVHLSGGYPVEPVDIHAVGPPPRRARSTC